MSRKRKTAAQSPEPPRQRNAVLQPPACSLAAILIIAFLIRLFYLSQIKSDVLSTHLVIDAEFYDRWAQRIAQGDWWGKTIFYQDPLYAYFLALIYKVFGHSFSAVRLIQALLDTATVVLIYRIARRLFNPLTGVVAAAMTALLSPLVYYVGLLDKTTLSVFLAAGALALVAESVASGGLALYAAAGAAFAVASLSRGNMLIVAAAIVPWLLWNQRSSEAFLIRLKRSACFAAAVAVIVGAVALRNYMVGGDLVLITANPGLNFFIGNNPYTIGQYIEPPFIHGVPDDEYGDAKSAAERFSGKKFDKPSEVSRYWMKQGASFIVQQPRQWLVLSARKLFLAFHDFEIAETYSYDYFREKYWSLALPFLTFGIIAPLGIVGALRYLLKHRLNELHVFLAVYTLSLVAFFVTSRYRVPLAVALVPFASWLLVDLWSSPMTLRSTVPTALVLAVLLVASRWQPPWFVERVSAPTLATAHMVAGSIDVRMKDFEGSVRELEAAIKANPRSGTSYSFLGDAYRDHGDVNSALASYEQAVRVNPQQHEAWEDIGVILVKLKDYRQAVVALQNALALRPQETLYRQNLNMAIKLMERKN